MSKRAKRALKSLVLVGLLFVINSILKVVQPSFPFRLADSLYLTVIATAFVFYISNGLVRGPIRSWITAAAFFMLLFILLRNMKYRVFLHSDVVLRHIWYLYYIPLLCIPMCFFYASLHIARERVRYTFILMLPCIVTVVLFLLFATNEMHFLAFRFKPGFENWNDDYNRGFLFYFGYIWIYLMLMAGLLVLIKKSAGSVKGGEFDIVLLPLLPLILGSIGLIVIAMDKIPRFRGVALIDFPDVSCFMLAAYWISCIRIGLFPTNAGYRDLFKAFGAAAQIVDHDGNVIYSSENAEELFRNKARQFRFHETAIRSGYVRWMDDITELNRVNRELTELENAISEETELIGRENELRQKRLELQERSRLYDMINQAAGPQLRKIGELIREAKQDPPCCEKNLPVICVLGAYIKRLSNLMILAEENTELSVHELALSVSESLNYLKFTGIPAVLSGSSDQKLDAKELIEIYSLFEQLLEESLLEVQGVFAVLSPEQGGFLHLTFEGVALKLPEKKQDASLKLEDDCTYVRIWFGRSGNGGAV
ncbi:MAG: hypothetical protein Q4E57_05050 [Eubacteriales bacterium]|nr:hypothetical protein [Eubacteriales bacterium]